MEFLEKKNILEPHFQKAPEILKMKIGKETLKKTALYHGTRRPTSRAGRQYQYLQIFIFQNFQPLFDKNPWR
jgi:hypothetical protein